MAVSSKRGDITHLLRSNFGHRNSFLQVSNTKRQVKNQKHIETFTQDYEN